MPAAKKPVKKNTTKKTVKKITSIKSKPTKAAGYESFKLGKEVHPFWTFKVTIQTKYWIILLSIITVLQLWIIFQGIGAANVIESLKY